MKLFADDTYRIFSVGFERHGERQRLRRCKYK